MGPERTPPSPAPPPLRQLPRADELRRDVAQAALADQLASALESRVVIEQAKGYLSYEHGTTVGSAFSLLRRHARSHQLPLRDVAQGVVDRRLVL
jgi:AmiR/NasT family two-component response regulator